jgi:hypothetical protein
MKQETYNYPDFSQKNLNLPTYKTQDICNLRVKTLRSFKLKDPISARSISMKLG